MKKKIPLTLMENIKGQRNMGSTRKKLIIKKDG